MLLLLFVIILIAPWGKFPINDDWQLAHIARNFAERGVLAIDLPNATSIVGQSILAWPAIHFFGFSFLNLRLLTLACSILIVIEVDYLLRLAGALQTVRLLTLCLLVVNPFFLYFSTSFMTEHYSLVIALLSACVWYRGRKDDDARLLILAAAIAGYAFWIRQLSALVFPAMLLAELITRGKPGTRRQMLSRAASATVWLAIVLAFFRWARLHGSQTKQASDALSRIRSPDPVILFFEFGIFVFYVTFFAAPFLVPWLRKKRPRFRAFLVPAFLVLSAAFAVYFGDTNGAPRSNIHPVFPFLHNVVTQYGVGPILLTDVYMENSGVRPHAPAAPWIIIELLLIAISIAWVRALVAVRSAKNEIAVFGICFALLNYAAVGLAFETAIFDRYHYNGIVGVTVALAAILPASALPRFTRAAVVWIVSLGVFSTLALHDQFRWQEARAELAVDAQRLGIKPSQVDAGYEINGWNDIERLGVSPDCGGEQFWFCGTRPYRIGTTKYPADQVVMSKRISWWFLPFPDMLLLKRGSAAM